MGSCFISIAKTTTSENISTAIDHIGHHYGPLLEKMEWVSLGGGGLFLPSQGIPSDRFCEKLKQFSDKFDVQVYLNPETAIPTARNW